MIDPGMKRFLKLAGAHTEGSSGETHIFLESSEIVCARLEANIFKSSDTHNREGLK